MAIHHKNGCRDLLVRALDIYGGRVVGITMAEFGNQKLKFEPGEGARRLQNAKPYFEFLGMRHVSFDTNGRGDCVVQDLSKPIRAVRLRKLTGLTLGEFDIVTNFGTSEHVEAESQRQVFQNAHDLCRYGGLMVHAVPRAGTCRHHGVWKYTADWFEDLAKANGYRIEHLQEWDKSAKWPEKINPGDEIYVLAIFRKAWERDGAVLAQGSIKWPGEPVRE